MNAKYGVIMTRHVTSHETNHYWNYSINCLHRIYPHMKIVIIDDNSNYQFVKSYHQCQNVEIIQSEFKGRGELLPYVYYIKQHFFDNALIIHDSVFIHSRINFDKLINDKIQVRPVWFFYPDKEDIENRLRIASKLNNAYGIMNQLTLNDTVLGMPHLKWYGCFGVQCFINRDFLLHLQRKYSITNLVDAVYTRKDRQCLERIFGCLFFAESKPSERKSLLGDIMKYQKYGYTYKQYVADIKKGRLPKTIVKVWTGR